MKFLLNKYFVNSTLEQFIFIFKITIWLMYSISDWSMQSDRLENWMTLQVTSSIKLMVELKGLSGSAYWHRHYLENQPQADLVSLLAIILNYLAHIISGIFSSRCNNVFVIISKNFKLCNRFYNCVVYQQF